jgi:hypothetical protein
MESLPNVHFAFFYTDPSWNVFIINIARGWRTGNEYGKMAAFRAEIAENYRHYI